MARTWTAAEARAECEAARYNKSVRLSTGAQLSYADVGDPKGRPVLWLWGLSGHRYLALLLHEAAAAQQLRVLCVDRPGQGGSTPPVAGGMRVLAWPAMVSELADQLELEHLSVVGNSCGALFAMACALPSQPICERIVGPVVLVSPWVPLASGVGSARCNWLARLPGFVHNIIGGLVEGSVPQYIGGRTPPSWWARNVIPGEQSSLEWAAWGSAVNAGLAEAIAAARRSEGGTQSATADLRLCLGSGHPLGFEYKQVVQRVVVYHGKQDTLVPLSAAEWVHTVLPDSVIVVCNGGTHQMYLLPGLLASVCRRLARPVQLVEAPAA